MSTDLFKPYERFDQADNARRDGPDLYRLRTQRCRRKASELRSLAGRCTQEAVRNAFLDMAQTYDRLANETVPGAPRHGGEDAR